MCGPPHCEVSPYCVSRVLSRLGPSSPSFSMARRMFEARLEFRRGGGPGQGLGRRTLVAFSP